MSSWAEAPSCFKTSPSAQSRTIWISYRRIPAKAYPSVNGAVSAYADEIPYNFEDRLVDIELETKAVIFKTPSPEDLAVMKLYAWRPNDIADLTSPSFLEKLDWNLLDQLVHDKNEAQASALSMRRYREMVDTYERYREEYRPCT